MTRINWNKMTRADRLSRSADAQVRYERDVAGDILVPGREGSYSVRAKFELDCSCGGTILTGDRAWYYPNGPREQKMLCEACGLVDHNSRTRSWTERN